MNIDRAIGLTMLVMVFIFLGVALLQLNVGYRANGYVYEHVGMAQFEDQGQILYTPVFKKRTK